MPLTPKPKKPPLAPLATRVNTDPKLLARVLANPGWRCPPPRSSSWRAEAGASDLSREAQREAGRASRRVLVASPAVGQGAGRPERTRIASPQIAASPPPTLRAISGPGCAAHLRQTSSSDQW
jgi:hypothetical protein